PWGEAVVAADDVDGGEPDIGPVPPDVLRDPELVLGVHRYALLPQGTTRLSEEHLAYLGQPLQRVVRAVVGPVAVGPLVVADGVDQRVLELVEVALDQLEVLVAADAR